MKSSMKRWMVLTAVLFVVGTIAAQDTPATTPPAQAPSSQTPPAQTAPTQAPPEQTPPAQTAPAQSAPLAPQTPPYQPKFKGDPARSESEADALAYMRVVLRAQRLYKKQHDDQFATSLSQLVHVGSFTKRMVNPERGDYTAGFKGKKDSFVLTMTPKNMDAQHRSFYAEDDGKIHADDSKPADASSPVVK